MIIDLTGEVVPCCFWSGYGNTGKPLGNTNVQTIDEIWNGEAYRELRRRNASGELKGFPCHECMSYRWSNGQYPKFSWSASFVPDSGHCHYTLIPEAFRAAVEGCEEPVRVYEDGKPLPSPDAMHDDIRKDGLGRYSVWGKSLYFSTSDNSDPVTNGRVYELRAGACQVTLQNLITDSLSGHNLIKAHDEYQAGTVVMTAKPTMISLISTADCNIDCPACSQNIVRLARVQHRPETVPDVLAHMPYLHQFIWHGGEPYLIKRFREFIDTFQTADNPNLTFGFTSNGTMLTSREVEKLKKFPRINASISVDSFVKETFEQIRAGSQFESVMTNLGRALEIHDAPKRVFSVGMIICKTNFLELAHNLQYAIDHDIGLNLSPILIYPLPERLDIFQDFVRQTQGWREALDHAEVVVHNAKVHNRLAVQRIDPEGMVKELCAIYEQAKKRYSEAVPVYFMIEDPFHSLAEMRRPGIQLYHWWGRLVGYAGIQEGADKHVMWVPRSELQRGTQLWYTLVHDLFEPMGSIAAGRVKCRGVRDGVEKDEMVLDVVTIRVPQYKAVLRPTNMQYANYGETSPDGLFVKDQNDIFSGYQKLVKIERLNGTGVAQPSLSVTMTQLARRVLGSSFVTRWVQPLVRALR